LNIYLSEIKT